jgi:hypothetical protein
MNYAALHSLATGPLLAGNLANSATANLQTFDVAKLAGAAAEVLEVCGYVPSEQYWTEKKEGR